MTLGAKCSLALSLLLVGLVGDTWSTYYVLNNNDSAFESNPTASWLIERGMLLTAKLSVFLVIVFAIIVGQLLHKPIDRAVNWILVVAVIHLVIVTWNLQGVIL